MNFKKYIKVLIAAQMAVTVLTLTSCDNNIDEQISVTFGPVFYVSTIESNPQASVVTLNFSKPLYEDAQLKIGVNGNGANYGSDYTTNPPELVAGEIIVFANAGSSSVSFSVSPVDNDKFTNGAKLNFSVAGLNGILKSYAGNDFTFEIIDDDIPPILADMPFDGCTEFQVPEPFFEEIVPGFKTDRGWGCRPFGLADTEGLQASAFGGEPGSDNAWLILNPNDIDLNAGGKLDISTLTSFYFKVWIESFFAGSGTIQMYYSFDYPGSGNPEEYTWEVVAGFESQLPEAGSGGDAGPDGLFVPVFVSLNELIGKEKAFIAIQYEGGSSSSSSSWTLDDVQFLGE